MDLSRRKKGVEKKSGFDDWSNKKSQCYIGPSYFYFGYEQTR